MEGPGNEGILAKAVPDVLRRLTENMPGTSKILSYISLGCIGVTLEDMDYRSLLHGWLRFFECAKDGSLIKTSRITRNCHFERAMLQQQRRQPQPASEEQTPGRILILEKS